MVSQLYVNLLSKCSQNFPLHTFISSQEVKCSPKQNFFDSIIFFYITLKLLEKDCQGPIIRENSVLPNWLTRFTGNSPLQKFSQQSQNFIFMAHVKLVIGVVGFISKVISKNSLFPSSWVFPEKNLFAKGYYEKKQLMYSATLVSQILGGGSYQRQLQLFSPFTSCSSILLPFPQKSGSFNMQQTGWTKQTRVDSIPECTLTVV